MTVLQELNEERNFLLESRDSVMQALQSARDKQALLEVNKC